nr:hypothetical protein GCM10020092_056560 [Actinoplanes digitatis]
MPSSSVTLNATKITTAPHTAAANGSRRNRPNSINGSSRHASTRTKASAATAITTYPQPSRGASMRTATVVATRMLSSTWPGRSSRRGRGERDSGTYTALSTRTIAMIGRLIQNTARHPDPAISAPPSTGPAAMLSPNTAAQTPMACARSRGSVITPTTMASATGLSIDPPTPCNARAATSTSRPGATAQPTDPAANNTSPIRNTRRRPTRSASAPEVINKPSQHQRVRVDDPFQFPYAEPQLLPDRRQRHVDRRRVQPHQEDAGAADRQYQPSTLLLAHVRNARRGHPARTSKLAKTAKWHHGPLPRGAARRHRPPACAASAGTAVSPSTIWPPPPACRSARSPAWSPANAAPRWTC